MIWKMKQDTSKLKVCKHIICICITIVYCPIPITLFQVVSIPGKGRGVIATDSLRKGDYVCEYSGDRINFLMKLQRKERISTSPMTKNIKVICSFSNIRTGSYG